MKLVDCRASVVPTTTVKQLLSDAVWAPTEENLNRILDQVYSDSSTVLYALVDNDVALGIAGLKRTAGNSAELLHIAVDKQKRNQGIGRKIVDELLAVEKLTKLIAETDHSAVGFYREYGFSIHSLGEKYPGVERFLCTLNLSF